VGVSPAAQLWFTSPQQGWAVLGDVVARSDGRNWKTFVDFGEVDPGWYYYLTAVSTLSTDDVWVGGNRRNYKDEVRYVLKRFDGSRWHDVTIPGVNSTAINSIYFTGLDTAWVSSDEGLFYYDHGAWEKRYAGYVGRITASEPGDVWAVEHLALGDDLIRWDGQTWTRQKLGDYFDDNIFIRSLAFTNPADGWVAGEAVGLNRGVFLMHFDGQRWKFVAGSDAAGASACDFCGVWTGWFGCRGVTYFYNGRTFHDYGLPENVGADVSDIWILGPERAWAITAAGPAGPFYVLRFDGFK
jgi:hypothetical protein